MPYMLLIVEPVGQRVERGQEDGRVVYDRMVAFSEEIRAEGRLLATSSLATSAVRLRKPKGTRTTQVVDGPFAEAKEMIGGFFLLNCTTQEEALAWAERCPAAEWATVEVRETGPCYT